MKKIAIIGHGYVGQAIDRFFEQHYDIVLYDPLKNWNGYKIWKDKNLVFGENGNFQIWLNDERDLTKIVNAEKGNVNACDFAVICVPTPMKEDGICDTSLIEETVEWLQVPLILIKSTILPRTVKRLVEKTGKKVAFSPEYIGEGKYFIPYWKYPHATDMKYHDFMIIGGERETTSGILEFFKGILGPSCRFFQMDSTTAELVKYMENSWGATKVTFANEFFEIAKAFGVDYDELREMFLLDGRVERIHTAVFKEKRGFGGKCFPKDVNAIVKASEEAGYVPELLKEVIKSNDKFIKFNPK